MLDALLERAPAADHRCAGVPSTGACRTLFQIPDAAAKYPGEIARDVGLLALSVWLVVRPRSRLALDSALFGSTTDNDEEGSLDGAEEDLAQDR